MKKLIASQRLMKMVIYKLEGVKKCEAKEMIKRKGHVEKCAQFQREFSEKYNVSRLTFIRALNELRSRGIVVSNISKLDVVEQYNIYETIKEAKSLLIILKTT